MNARSILFPKAEKAIVSFPVGHQTDLGWGCWMGRWLTAGGGVGRRSPDARGRLALEMSVVESQGGLPQFLQC